MRSKCFPYSPIYFNIYLYQSYLVVFSYTYHQSLSMCFFLRGVRLPVVVWGKVAMELSKSFHLLIDKSLICVMRFGKIKVWQGKHVIYLYIEKITRMFCKILWHLIIFTLTDERSVCNIYNVSSIALNPSTEDVENFIAMWVCLC